VQRGLRLLQHVAGVLHERHLLIALEVRRPDIGRVAAGPLGALVEQTRHRRLGGADRPLHPADLEDQFLADLLELLVGPGVLPLRDGDVFADPGGVVRHARNLSDSASCDG